MVDQGGVDQALTGYHFSDTKDSSEFTFMQIYLGEYTIKTTLNEKDKLNMRSFVYQEQQKVPGRFLRLGILHHKSLYNL